MQSLLNRYNDYIADRYYVAPSETDNKNESMRLETITACLQLMGVTYSVTDGVIIEAYNTCVPVHTIRILEVSSPADLINIERILEAETQNYKPLAESFVKLLDAISDITTPMRSLDTIVSPANHIVLAFAETYKMTPRSPEILQMGAHELLDHVYAHYLPVIIRTPEIRNITLHHGCIVDSNIDERRSLMFDKMINAVNHYRFIHALGGPANEPSYYTLATETLARYDRIKKALE
jgi:hypothetical protein